MSASDFPTRVSGSSRPSGRRLRLAAAFAVAAVSDALSAWTELVLPLQWGIDLLTAGLLFLLLGRQWLILPGLIAEAIPGLAVFPLWLLVVASVATWGTISRKAHSPPHG